MDEQDPNFIKGRRQKQMEPILESSLTNQGAKRSIGFSVVCLAKLGKRSFSKMSGMAMGLV